jgi:hypothetical protein
MLCRAGTSGLLRLFDGDELTCCFFSTKSLDSLCFKGVALTIDGGAADLTFLLLLVLDAFFGLGGLAPAGAAPSLDDAIDVDRTFEARDVEELLRDGGLI